MELIFIRHAQPAWVEDGKSRIDPRLSALGLQQAEALAQHAKEWSESHELFVSPAERARQTAEPLARALGLEPQQIDWFEELRLPSHWEGSPADNVIALMRGRLRQTRSDWDNGIMGAEPFADFERRIVGGLSSLLHERGTAPSGDHAGHWQVADPKRRLIFVGHGGSNSVAIGHLLGLPSVPWPWERLVALHASVSRVKSKELLGGRIFGLRDHSNVGFMPKSMRSR